MVDEACVGNALFDSAKEVFETMIFMEVVEDAEQEKEIDGWGLLAAITFKGPVQGCFAMCSNIECCQAVAKSMLGMEDNEQISEEETCDAIGEVANMLMGSTKTRLMDQFGDVEVSIPSVISGKELRNNLGEGSKKLTSRININNKYAANMSLLYRETDQQ